MTVTDEPEWEGDRPTSPDTLGRPDWWFLGSFFMPTSAEQQRHAQLHRRTLTRAEAVLSVKAQTLRRYICTLNQWFPLPVLDAIAKHLVLRDQRLPKTGARLLALLLGYIEASLREKGETITWRVLDEINHTFETRLRKADYRAHVFKGARALVLSPFNRFTLIRMLFTNQLIQRAALSADLRHLALQQGFEILADLQAKRFVCKDPELLAVALARVVLNENGAINVAQAQKEPAMQIIYRLRQHLQTTSLDPSMKLYQLVKQQAITQLLAYTLPPDPKLQAHKKLTVILQTLQQQKVRFNNVDIFALAVVRIALNDTSPAAIAPALRGQVAKEVYRLRRHLNLNGTKDQQ